VSEPRFEGSRVALPPGVQRPLQVFVNGLVQQEGLDYAIDGAEVVFAERLTPPRPTRLRDLARLMVAGRYTPEHTVDLVHFGGGARQMVHKLEVLPPHGAHGSPS
jgi:hypothetical protein